MKATKEVEKMCTFEEMIRRIEKDETLLAVYSNMKNAAYDDNTICSMLGISMWKLQQFKKRLSHNAVLQPKTV